MNARPLPLFKLLVRPSAPGDAHVTRRGEPVTAGVPLPRGLVTEVESLGLEDRTGTHALQARVLDRWPDGSVRWALLDFHASVGAGHAGQYTVVMHDTTVPPGRTALAARSEGRTVIVETGVARFVLSPGQRFPFESVSIDGDPVIDAVRTTFEVRDAAGVLCHLRAQDVAIEETGPLRVAVRIEGRVGRTGRTPLLDLTARLHFFAGSATVRFALTLQNPRAAVHRGGLWDLGDPHSVYLQDASLTVALPSGTGRAAAVCTPEPGVPPAPCDLPFELYQDSSGGEHWLSTNHVNRDGVVPHAFRGYRARSTDTVAPSSTMPDVLGRRALPAGRPAGLPATPDCREGLRGCRATPALSLERGTHKLAIAVPAFWQNFPKALEATESAIVLRLFPGQFCDLHEIQPGEQKTHTFGVAFSEDAVADVPLDWCRAPLLAHASPEWYCTSGAVPYLTPATEDPHSRYRALVNAAIEGDDTFEHKREVIDEYGWRHFGEIYGDHEAIRHTGPAPLVSHYNNQYDPVAGFAYQFLMTGDARWWRQMDELAAHVVDIDVYHTDEDKAAYNHGLFWHTCHYIDADTATHRSYPRRSGVAGGGPSSEHNYATGLRLHYLLTGNPLSRDAAIQLARFALDIDHGRHTVFRWLAAGPTGLASASGSFDYHGPGRGGANSVHALLDGYLLTGERRFLDGVERLLRRCIHPSDDVDAHNLLDAERKWFYTMFLQALGRYLDCKEEIGEPDEMYAYGRESLLHYARWMLAHEYPYLDKPHDLQYPTETWAAQDMRKSEVFKYAVRHAQGDERRHFQERAEFFFRYATTTLSGMPTRTLARPVVLLLCHGFMHAWFARHPETAAPAPAWKGRFPARRPFVPQRARALRRAKALGALGLLGMATCLAWLALAL